MGGYVKKFVYLFLSIAMMAIVTGCGGGGGDDDGDGGNGPTPKSIQLTFANGETGATAPVGTTGRLVAILKYSDGTTEDITDRADYDYDSSVVSIEADGSAKAIGAGSTDIVAKFGGVDSNAVELTVTTVTLESITVHPDKTTLHVGESVRYTADGHYSDGTIVDISKDVSWSSGDTAVMTIDSEGMAKAVGAGDTTIKAVKDGKKGTAGVSVKAVSLESIQLTFANGDREATVPKGTTGRLVATAYYSDGSSADVTADAQYDYDAKIVEIGIGGDAKAIGVGSTDIVAKFGGVGSNEVKLAVTATTLKSITVSSDKPELIVGTSTKLTAIGVYSDGSDVDITKDVSWSSSDTDIVTVVGDEAKGVGVGSAVVTATLDGVTGNTELKVEQAQVTDLRIVKDDTALSSDDEFVVGETLKVKALADFDNGMKSVDVTRKVTWQAGNQGTVSVDSNGLITAIEAGYAEVTAFYHGEFGSASDKITGTVVAKAIDKIQIFTEPDNASVPAGESIRLEAWATYNDGSNENVSDTVKWISGDKRVSIVNDKDEKCVYATSQERLVTTIEAEKTPTLKAKKTVTFDRKDFDHIEIQEGYCENGDCPVITGKTVDIPIVDDVNYDPVSEGAYYPTAWAVYSDGSKRYINTMVGIRWWSADQVRAYVNTIQGSFVFGRGVGRGIEISVSYRGEHKTSFFVNVVEDTNTKTLQKIGIKNTQLDGWGCSQSDNDYGGKLEMNIGDEGKYLQACGKFQYGDGSVKWEDINNNVLWSSSDAEVARVQTYTGELKALGAGNAVITAQLAEVKGSFDVTVVDKRPDHIEIQGYYPADSGNTKIITGKTVDIPIVDEVNYDPVSIGAYYPKAYLVFTDGSRQYINSTSGVRWWSSDQVRAFVDTTRGSFVFGRGVGNGIEISVSYRGEYRTSFFVNVYEDTTQKTLRKIGIKNTKDLGWGCTQNDSDYGTGLVVDKGDNGKYLMACGQFEYTNGNIEWEDINDNVAWFSSDDNVARMRTLTGELIAKEAGSTVISAQFVGVVGATKVTVNP